MWRQDAELDRQVKKNDELWKHLVDILVNSGKILVIILVMILCTYMYKILQSGILTLSMDNEDVVGNTRYNSKLRLLLSLPLPVPFFQHS